jgi:hypothetical protein
MASFKQTLLLLLISLPGVAQIGAKVQQQNKIYGLWQNSQFGYQMTLMLNPDGTGEFDGEMIKFSTQGDKLSIIQKGTTTVYNHALNGNSLTLLGGDLEKPISFTRNSSESSTAVVEVPVQQATTGISSDERIVGVWSGNNETIEFKTNGQCVYLGNTFQYQLSQGHVTLITNQGNVMFGYAVKNDQLLLTGNNKTVTYSKGLNGNPQNQANGKGQVAMELVGKWCYMSNSLNSSSNKCITLNADGTYIYVGESSRSVNTPEVYGGTASQGSDRGTWYVQGDRIYYNSQTSGQGSYRLEKRNHPKNVGDPMIVLDGEAYVTATLRDPWR